MSASRPRTARVADLLGGGFVALASLQFGGVVVLGKLLAEKGVSVPATLAVRFGLAGLLLGVVLALARMRLRAAPGEGARLVLLGAVGYAAESAQFFFALRYGTAAAVTLLFFSYPVWVALLSAALGMGVPGRLIVVSMVVTLAGSTLMVGTSRGIDIAPAGVALALGSSVTFSFYLVGAERVIKATSSPAAAMWVSLSAAGALAMVAVVGGQARLPSGGGEVLPVLGMGLFSAGAFICLFVGLRRLGAVRTAIVAAMEPVAAALLALVFLREPLSSGILVGGLLILAGAVTASLARRGVVEPEAPGP